MTPKKPDWTERAVAALEQTIGRVLANNEEYDSIYVVKEYVKKLLRAERRRMIKAIRQRGHEYMADSKKPGLTPSERCDLSGRAWAFKDLADELAASPR